MNQRSISESSVAIGFFLTTIAFFELYRKQQETKKSTETITSTEPPPLPPSSEKLYDCIIIGAGVSGLRAAKKLHHLYQIPNEKILLLEAQDYIGGRIKQSTTFIPGVKVELGAEILHGDNTLLTKFARYEGNEPIEEIYCWAHGDGGPLSHPVNGGYGLYYIGGVGENNSIDGKGKLLRFDETENKEFVRLNETLWDLAEHHNEDVFSEKTSLKQYLESLHFSNELINLADAGFANTLCTRIDELSLKQSVRWTRIWENDSEEGEFRLKNSYSALINYLRQSLHILTDTPVTNVQRIVYSMQSSLNHVVITVKDGRKFHARTVVISASPHVLKNNLITFQPALPEKKLFALQCTNMYPAMKVFVKFSEICWPKGLTGMIMTDPNFLFPEIWFRDVRDIVGTSASPDGVCYATGFATTLYAEKILSLSKEEVYRRFVNQLEVIFSQLEPKHWVNLPVVSLPKPSEVYLDGFMQVWNPEYHPYIGGGYCSPRVNYPVNSGALLAEPVDGLLYFSGEATNIGAGATAHAALESGDRCADQIAQYLKLKKEQPKQKYNK